MNTVRGRLLSALSAAVLMSVAVSSCSSPCDNLQTASASFNSKAAPCFGDGGYVSPATDAGNSGDAGAGDAGADAGPPDAGAGVPSSPASFNELVCENDITDCSKTDNSTLDRYASCLNSLSTCSPETLQAWNASVQVCTNELSSLSAPCAAAFAGNGGDGGT